MELKAEFTHEEGTEYERTVRKFLLIPGCCEENIKALRPYLTLDYPDSELATPENIISEWRIPNVDYEVAERFSTYSNTILPVKFCPYCGQKMPEVRLKKNPPSPVVTDGDGYCGTCDERYGRYGNCCCWPMESLFEVVK